MKRLLAVVSLMSLLAPGQQALAGLNTNVFLDPPFNGTGSVPIPQPPAGPIIEDPTFDLYCDRYKTAIDLRTSSNQVVNQITRIWVPRYRYWQCASDFWIWYDGIAQCCNPANTVIYTYEAALAPTPADCNNLPAIITNPKLDLTTPQYAGGGPNGWFGAWWMTDYTSPVGLPVGTRFNTYCSINPGTQNGLPWCGLTIYASSGHWCTSKRVGTVYGLTEITEACTPIRLTIDLPELVHQRDSGASVCRDLSGNLLFFAGDPGLWAGLPHGYLKISGNWILFSAEPTFNVGAMPAVPEALSRDFPDLLAQAATFNTATRDELLAVIQAKSLELIAAAGVQNLGGGIWAIALPKNTASACEILNFEISDVDVGFCPPPGCTDCTPPNSNGGLALAGTMTGSCPPDGGLGTGGSGSSDNTLLLAWVMDSNRFIQPRLLTDLPTLQDVLPTNLPPSGMVLLTNVYVPEGYAGVSVLLYALNRETGGGTIRTLNLPIKPNAVAIVTNLNSAVSLSDNGRTRVAFTFDVQADAPAALTYRIIQNDQMQSGVITGPTNQASLSFLTDRAGPVHLLFLNPCGTETFTSVDVSLDGPATPAIDLYTYYPDGTNLTLLPDGNSGSTIEYRVRNPRPGAQTVSYTLLNQETTEVLQSGTFTNASASVMSNQRLTKMSAYAASVSNSLLSASATRTARIHVETPQLLLPPVLHNPFAGAITNVTQAKRAYRNQLFSLQSASELNGFNSLIYPANGVIPVELDGNNVEPPEALGCWTNLFSNAALPNAWFQSGNLIDPPVRPEGSATATTRFDVADLAVNSAMSNGLASLAVSTATSNAMVVLERWVSDHWTTVQTLNRNPGTFANVNVGFTQRLVGRRDHYNPAYYALERFPYLDVNPDTCGGQVLITINPAVTNVLISGSAITTNIPAERFTADANEMLHFPLIGLPNGDYSFTAFSDESPITRNLALSGSFTCLLRLGSDGADFISGINPTNNQPVYILDVRGAANPRLRLESADKPALAFASVQPAHVNRVSSRELEIDVSAFTVTTEFLVALRVDNQPCPDLLIPLTVIIRRGSPAFDIPVSDPKTGDCLKLSDGSIPRWP